MTPVTPTSFMNVLVTALPYVDPVSKKTKYKTTFEPAALKVTEADTVINYQLVSPTPAGVKFKSVTVKPGREDQLSEPSISESGKLVTFSDANTRAANFNLTLHFIDSDKIEFNVDPEIANEPDPASPAAREAYLMPEVANEPDPA
ncbi:DP-EP family protein [Pseudoduganella chitinolytica]|uniref:Uncharacterized protein n=1 Tax=Pseudoduganella chitinolytica TaxID=34070 RepID=A0ABY8BE05_9BURK|nr:DP-EP family protein [Pseudoduganella chitinolytica]WEF34141.1 hypothetical protein PX653_05055 [Pseudoduganella chitinolytica]